MKVKNDDNSQGSLLTQLRREHFGWDQAGCRGGVAGGSISGLNSGKIGTIDIFVIWGFEGRRRGFEGQRQGVSRGSAKGFRGAAPLIKDFSDLSFRAVPRGPI